MLFLRADGPVLALGRFNFESFELRKQDVAALFGLEIVRPVVDTFCPELVPMQMDVERRRTKSPQRRACNDFA